MPEPFPLLNDWYRAHARDLPWRRPGFSAWGVLVSEFMLQQTQVSRVIPRLKAWLDRWPTPAALAAASPGDAVLAWENLGYPRRALWLYRAAVQIRDRHGGEVPRAVHKLRELTGVGDYTARAVAVFAYGDRHPVVDTNTRRVLARAVHGRSHPSPPRPADLRDQAAILPEDHAEAAITNAATMELGATVCTARRPECNRCPLSAQCRWRALGYPDTGDERRRQTGYRGSDRQARGAALRTLRHAPGHRANTAAVLSDWPDPAQRDRAIDSLIADGLIEAVEDRLTLPGG